MVFRCNVVLGRVRLATTAALILGVMTLFLNLLGSTAQAQITRTWDGGGTNNNWSTAGNWSSDNVPDTTAEAALFTDDPVGQTKLTPNLSADVTIGQLQFSATAPSYTITGTGASILYLGPTNSFDGAGITVASGAANQTIAVAEVFLLSSQSWNIGGTTILLVTGTIEDAASPDYALTKNGTGTLIFSGDVRYDGPTTNNAGTLVLSFSNTSMLSAFTVNAGILRATTSANALGSSSTRNTITLAGGALELVNNTGLTFGSASRLTTATGNATIRSDRLTHGVGVTHTLGTLRIGAQTLSVAAGTFVTNGTAGISFGSTTLTANGAVFNVASGANLTLGALVGDFAFTNQGSGQLTLNTAANANRTSARVTLSGGTMKLGNASAFGTAAVPLTLNGGTLDLAINGSVNAHITTVGGNATITSDRSTGGGGVTNTLGTLGIGVQTLSVTAGANVTSGTAGITFGATTLSGNATFDVVNSGNANAQLTLGAVGQSGGAQSLTKTGNGTLLLNGAGNYTGSTTLSQGAITLGVANALGSGGFNFAGGTLNANNMSDSTIGALTLTANSTLNLSPGGASATLTFAGVSGAANGILTITGWSGSAGGLGSNDKIVFSGGTTPDAAFLQHIHFDLGGENIYFGAVGAGGELFASAILVGSPIAVPDVALLTQSNATNAIVNAGLSVGNITSAPSGSVPAGSVISQNPVAGASVAAGTPVDLVMSIGPVEVIASITGEIEVVAIPPSLAGGAFISQTHIRLMHEGTGFVTAAMPAFLYDSAIHDPNLPVVPGDVTFGNAITINATGPGLPAVGTEVYSVLLHFDPNLSGVLPLDITQGIARSGTITFNREILGVYVTSGALNTTDPIFDPGTIFSSSAGRDMEFNYDGDAYSISPDRHTLSLTMYGHNGGVLDEMRIILAMNPPSVTVPNVVGQTQSVAAANLAAADVSVGAISNASSATHAAGIVLEQNPSAGASVPPGTAIALLISTGPSVPDVVNLTEAVATNAIISAGLSVGAISNAPHGIVPAGSVSSQNPVAGTSVPIGSPVNLVVSSGATDPVVREAAYQDGEFRVSVPTLSGRLYILQFIDQLPGTNWTDLQSVSGDGTLRILIDSSATTNRQRFYRVRME